MQSHIFSEPSVEPPNLCTDYETLAELGPVACWEPLSELYHGFIDMYGHCV